MTFTRTARILGVAAVTAAALHAVPAGAATSHRADTGALTSKSLTARTVLTSTSGKKLTLTVSGVGTSSGSTVSVGLASGNESHTWSFQAPASALKVGSTGAGTLVLTNVQTGNRGTLNLRFSPAGAIRKRTCNGKLASASKPVSVSGIAFFKTGTRPWGNVGRATKAISFGSTRAVGWTYDVTCATPPAPCTEYLSWSSWQFGSTVMQGVSGTRRGTTASAMGFRSTTLASPKGASRTDVVSLPKVALPTFAGDTSAASVTAKNGTGSVTVAGTDGFGYDVQCGSGGTARLTQWQGTATNGSTAFRIPAQVFGAFSVPNGTAASIMRQTV